MTVGTMSLLATAGVSLAAVLDSIQVSRPSGLGAAVSRGTVALSRTIWSQQFGEPRLVLAPKFARPVLNHIPMSASEQSDKPTEAKMDSGPAKQEITSKLYTPNPKASILDYQVTAIT